MAKPKEIKQIIKELNSQAIFIKGFDKALWGTGKSVGGNTVAVYNSDECLDILIEEHEMGELEAWEHFNVTVVNGTPSPNKPIFMSDWRWAVSIDQVLKDIKIDKQKTLDDIIDQFKENKEEKDDEDKKAE